MPKYTQEIEGEDGWSDNILPVMNKPYKMACCDCGLVHDIEFSVVKAKPIKGNLFSISQATGKFLRVSMRARRNNRSTGQVRRHKNNAPKQSR